MAFDSFSAFVWMEGHGPYVWTCFAVFALLLGGQMIASLQRHRRVMRSLHRQNMMSGEDPRKARQRAAVSASFAPVQTSEHERS
ncbi:MAG: heme exporter protein CcmD [Pseudomonadota bacterium]|nr:heme exporter protein CcmD [Pseudomonadota bacterium]